MNRVGLAWRGNDAWLAGSAIGAVALWVVVAAARAQTLDYEVSAAGITITLADGRRREYPWTAFRDWQQHGSWSTGLASFIEPRTARLVLVSIAPVT
ncbi:MAG TPA: hypothetical protein VM327_05910 [Candidatus Thermoplasmatota archaeon]|nr:hypothetical protein [Candidatus Thermoplasmatota archaeon]